MPATAARPSPNLFTLKITIKHTKPQIWRRVTMPGSSTLEQVHQTIQSVFDWHESHLHCFEAGPIRIGCLEHWEGEAAGMGDETVVTLDGLRLAPKSRILYTYDFGDDWEHDILVEKVERPAPRSAAFAIRCVAGRRRAPIEDSRGPWGWANLIEAVNDPSHEDHDVMIEWAGGPVDPDEMDLNEINARLALPWDERFRL